VMMDKERFATPERFEEFCQAAQIIRRIRKMAIDWAYSADKIREQNKEIADLKCALGRDCTVLREGGKRGRPMDLIRKDSWNWFLEALDKTGFFV